MPHRRWQFSLSAIFVTVTLVAICLAASQSWGVVGVVDSVGLIVLVSANLALAEFGGRFGQPVIASVLGGSMVWSAFAVLIGFLDAGVFRWSEQVVFILAGVASGSLCGIFARRKRRQIVAPTSTRHHGLLFCLLLLCTLIGVLGVGQFVGWRKLMQPTFSSTHVYSTNADGPCVVEFWGMGTSDTMLRWHLSEIPKKRKLAIYFHHTQVTDDGLRELGEYQNLVSVDLRETRVTESGVDLLRRTLPNCTIRY